MKRLIFIIIAAAIVGKLFSVAMVHIAENSKVASHNLGRNLFLENETNNQLKVAQIPQNLNISKQAESKPLPPVVSAPQPIKTSALKVTPVAKEETKKIEEAKKERERRKKRKKKLEEKANELAKNKASQRYYRPIVQMPDGPSMPDNANTFVGLPPSRNGSYTTTITTNLPVNTAPKAIGAPNKVSTLSTTTINAWIKLLTTNPSAAAMTSFETQYSKHVFSEAQYYQVLNAMIVSTNTEARNFSVQGADLYKTIYSFKLLADESENETDPTIKALATSAITKYGVAAQLPILTVASTSGDAAEKLWAEQLIKIIAATSSTSTTPVAATGP